MTTTTMTTLEAHKRIVEALNNPSYADGTYDMKTLETKEFKKGFQVTFWNVGDDYTAERYDYLVSLFTELSMDGRTYIGKYGTGEISWRFENKKLAKRYARLFNQISIWDWKHCKEIKTGGTGRR